VQKFGVSLPGGTTPPPTGGVVFYQHTHFGGVAGQALPVGSYSLTALVARGVQNDWASSVKVPAGRSVTMYQHDNFTGTQWTVSGHNNNFLLLQPNANDQVSSVVVK
jgi:hypothetical protein